MSLDSNHSSEADADRQRLQAAIARSIAPYAYVLSSWRQERAGHIYVLRHVRTLRSCSPSTPQLRPHRIQHQTNITNSEPVEIYESSSAYPAEEHNVQVAGEDVSYESCKRSPHRSHLRHEDHHDHNIHNASDNQ